MKICVWTGARIWKICSSIEQSERRKYRNYGQITISHAFQLHMQYPALVESENL